YRIEEQNDHLCLSREPIRRFEELDIENVPSMIIQKYDNIAQIVNILIEIKKENPTVEPDDIAIITLTDKIPYEYIDKLGYKILEELGWEINRGFDSRQKVKEQLFVSNQNHIKGLEFPFVICFTPKIKNNIRYRNSLYTMLTRSFIQSYLLVSDDQGIDIQKDGLQIINAERCIKTIEPTNKEKEDINKTIIELQKEVHISYKDFLTKIFNDLKIDTPCRKKFEKSLIDAEIEKFDKEATIDFIETNKRFFCK
ncbi:MAG TPA: ATP-dependent helicase, partial [Arcobacter sp.]|nr:ATP-dependent helicase [Arcobacter sp.]